MDIKSNIVFFVTGLDSGGLENYLLRFLEHKATAFNHITVFCKGGKGGQLESKYLSIPNLEIHIKHISFFNPLDYLYIHHFFKKKCVNVVCDFTGNFAGLILLSAWYAKVSKRVAFYRGSNNHFQESKLRVIYDKFVKKLVYENASNILSNSKTALNFFYPNKWEKDSRFVVIYNGINPKSFIEEKGNLRDEFNIPHDAFVVGHAGRYNVAKNHNTIIKVAIELCNKYDNIYFLMCGNSVKDNLQVQVENENLTNKIKLSNNRSDIPKFLKTLDCFYFPSLTEGNPNALIEAMIVNLPIIASDIDPIKESVPDIFKEELIPACSLNQAIEKIEKVYTNRGSYKLGDWALKKYDYKFLFEQFFNVLSN